MPPALSNTMTNPTKIIAIMAALLLAGCASFKPDATPRDKYADAERAFIVVVDTAKAAVVSGKLKGPTLALVKASLIEANGALDAMKERVKSGNAPEADYWLARVEAAVRAAQAYLVTPASDATIKG